MPVAGIGTLDWIVISLYFGVVIAIAGWAIVKERRGGETSTDYFLAGRNIGWFVVGASLFASNISTIHLVGLAASGFQEGLVWGNFEWIAMAYGNGCLLQRQRNAAGVSTWTGKLIHGLCKRLGQGSQHMRLLL